MPTFTYKARSRSGESKQGDLEAADKRAAMSQLSRMGLVPILVQEGAAAKPAKKLSRNGAKKAGAKSKSKEAATPKKKFKLERKGAVKMKLRDVLIFSKELSDLLSSGMTLGNALGAMAKRNPESPEGQIPAALQQDIVQGASLSEALARHPDTFPDFYVNLVKAGESSGKLSESLNHLVSYYERMLDAKEKVTMALVYPSIVMVIGLGTVIFCMVYVVPKFTGIFEQLDQALPLPTRMLIGISDFFIQYGLVAAAVLGLAFVLLRQWMKTENGQYAWDGFLLKMPIVKGIIRTNAFSNFARTLGSLLENGVPVLKALGIAENTVGNRVIAEQVSEARQRVTDGSSISKPLAQGQVFPVLFTDMLSVGEQSGNVPGSLKHIAKRYDDELERNIKVFTTVLEPILMLFMAIAVGFVALSMLSAVFTMTSGLE